MASSIFHRLLTLRLPRREVYVGEAEHKLVFCEPPQMCCLASGLGVNATMPPSPPPPPQQDRAQVVPLARLPVAQLL